METKEIDYGKLGFKAGLEVHQQLDTSKLYCNCPSLLRKDEPDFVVKRKLHAVAGESGEIDLAAIYQSSLDKEFEYQAYDTTCLVELDEEPPREINKEALKISLHIAFLMNMKILPISQIMRKTVIDGSNTSGFQRTLLVARDGYINTENGRVGISALYLEEDAARTVDKGRDKTVYRLDRLGIPLVEIVTEPDIKNPEQAKQVALQIGNILRSCKVKRGIGTIRQDVNVSIKEGKRVEIKGMQDMKVFEKAIENEVLRHKELSDSGKPVENEVRNVLPDATTKYLRPLPGSARMYPETDLPLLRISRSFIDDAKKTLPKLKSEEEKSLKKLGLSEDMIKLLFKREKIEEFKELIRILNKPQLIAKVILMFPKEIASHNKLELEKVDDLLEDNYSDVIDLVAKGKISENQVKIVLEKIANGVKLKDAIKVKKQDLNSVEEKIRKIIKSKPGLSDKAYMGLVMKEFKGQIDGREAMEIIKKCIK